MQRIRKYLKDNRMKLLFVLCLVLSRILGIFFASHGVNLDEAAIDYNIFCISNYGVDRYGNPFPVYFANQLSGQSALYIYLGAFLTKIIGFSVEKCRLVKLAAELVTFVFGGRVLQELYDKRAERIFYFLYIICPYFFMMSGISFDCDLIIPVFVFCIYLSERCIREGKTRQYIGLGICIGLLSYSYIIGVLMVPLFLLYQFIADKNRKSVCKAAAAAILLDVPIGCYVLRLLHVIPEIRWRYLTIAEVSSARMKDLGFSMDNFLRLKYMFVTDPDCNFASSAAFGTIYQVSILFAAAGAVALLWKKRKFRFFGLFFTAFLPIILIKDATNYNYTVLYFFLLVFASCGLAWLMEGYRTLGWMIVAGYLVMFGFFCREYFMTETYIYSDASLIPAVREIEGDGRVMLDTTGVIQPECYVGIALEQHPDEILYDGNGNGLSCGNIVFNDYEHYEEYDILVIRYDVPYLYQPSLLLGLTDSQAEEIIRSCMEEGWLQKETAGYCIFYKQ